MPKVLSCHCTTVAFYAVPSRKAASSCIKTLHDCNTVPSGVNMHMNEAKEACVMMKWLSPVTQWAVLLVCSCLPNLLLELSCGDLT